MDKKPDIDSQTEILELPDELLKEVSGGGNPMNLTCGTATTTTTTTTAGLTKC